MCNNVVLKNRPIEKKEKRMKRKKIYSRYSSGKSFSNDYQTTDNFACNTQTTCTISFKNAFFRTLILLHYILQETIQANPNRTQDVGYRGVKEDGTVGITAIWRNMMRGIAKLGPEKGRQPLQIRSGGHKGVEKGPRDRNPGKGYLLSWSLMLHYWLKMADWLDGWMGGEVVTPF